MAKRLQLLLLGLLTIAFIIVILDFRHTSDAVHQWYSSYIHRLAVVDLPSINVTGADCTALFSGNAVELIKAIKFQRTYKKQDVEPEKFIKQASNCTQFVADRR